MVEAIICATAYCFTRNATSGFMTVNGKLVKPRLVKEA